MCGGGGSGGSGTQKYEWNDILAPRWVDTLDLGDALRQRPYQQYTGQRIANLSPDQQQAFGELRSLNAGIGNMTDPGFNGPNAGSIGAANDAIRQTRGTLDGKYLTGDGANPFSQANSFATQKNSYIGDSPQFQKVLQQGRDDITNSYNQGTSAELTRLMNMSGALGGSAHQNAMANNQAALGKQLSAYESGMQNDQYTRSGQLEAGDLARRGGLQEGFLNRGSQNYEQERGRQMGAIGAGNDQQALARQRAQDLLGVGDANRSYSQDLLNLGLQDWQDSQNHEFKMADWFSGLLGRAQGGMSPNMTTSQSGYAASPFSQLLGGAMMGRSLGLFG